MSAGRNRLIRKRRRRRLVIGAGVVVVAIVAIMLLLAAWALSFLGAVVAFSGFEVQHAGGRLRIRRGLLQQQPVAAVVLHVEDEHQPVVGDLVGRDVLAEAPQHRAGVVVVGR